MVDLCMLVYHVTSSHNVLVYFADMRLCRCAPSNFCKNFLHTILFGVIEKQGLWEDAACSVTLRGPPKLGDIPEENWLAPGPPKKIGFDFSLGKASKLSPNKSSSKLYTPFSPFHYASVYSLVGMFVRSLIIRVILFLMICILCLLTGIASACSRKISLKLIYACS